MTKKNLLTLATALAFAPLAVAQDLSEAERLTTPTVLRHIVHAAVPPQLAGTLVVEDIAEKTHSLQRIYVLSPKNHRLFLAERFEPDRMAYYLTVFDKETYWWAELEVTSGLEGLGEDPAEALQAFLKQARMEGQEAVLTHRFQTFDGYFDEDRRRLTSLGGEPLEDLAHAFVASASFPEMPPSARESLSFALALSGNSELPLGGGIHSLLRFFGHAFQRAEESASREKGSEPRFPRYPSRWQSETLPLQPEDSVEEELLRAAVQHMDSFGELPRTVFTPAPR